MKKLLLLAIVMGLAAMTHAQTITCAITGLTTAQQTIMARTLARVNADRAAQTPSLAPFADTNAYCAFAAQANILETIRAQQSVDAAKAAAAFTAHGDDVAPTNQCTVAGLGAGCSKAQVACWVLSGSTTCQ